MDVDLETFESLVARALDDLPGPFAELLDNVVVTVEELPSDEDLLELGMLPDERHELLGLYHGVPQDERGAGYSALPDRVVLYRQNILLECQTEADVVGEVRDTVVHELGHHFGLSDEDMPY